MSTTRTILRVSPFALADHPSQIEIYGSDHKNLDAGFIESVSRVGLLQMPIVTPNEDTQSAEEYRIISGHRRVEACRFLDINEIEVELKTYKSSDEEEFDVIASNKSREKSTRQIVNEIMTLVQISRQKLDNFDLQELAENQKQQNTPSVSMDTGERMRDKIAESVGASAVQVARVLRIFDDHYRMVFFERFWNDVESLGGKYNGKIELECIESWDALREAVLSGECSIRAAYDSVGKFRSNLLAAVETLERRKSKPAEGRMSKPPRVPVLKESTENNVPFNVSFTRHLSELRPELLACIDEEYHADLDDSVRSYVRRCAGGVEI